MLKSLIAHPLTHGLDLNDPLTTSRQRQIITEKKFLKEIYTGWYRLSCADLWRRFPTVFDVRRGLSVLAASGKPFALGLVRDLCKSITKTGKLARHASIKRRSDTSD
jgi:hypothetical protein